LRYWLIRHAAWRGSNLHHRRSVDIADPPISYEALFAHTQDLPMLSQQIAAVTVLLTVHFRYHQLFLDFLRHRLGRDEPERVARLHGVASTWFAEYRMVSEAVDHALAAGDDQRAVQLVENDGIYLVANSQMATLIGLVGKLPAAVVHSDPRVQLALGWANIVLHRIPAAEQALTLMESRLGSCDLNDDEITDLRAEGGVVRAVADLRSDRLAGITRWPTTPPLFVGRDGERISRGTLQSRIKRAGPDAQTVPGALVHGLRHTFATELANSDVSVYTLMKLLGHESMATSQRYVAAAGSETRSAAAKPALHSDCGRGSP
jgi:hypothetical protein